MKEMTLIALFNRAALGFDLPQKVEYIGTIYKFNKDLGDYFYYDDGKAIFSLFTGLSINRLNDKVKIIKEKEND